MKKALLCQVVCLFVLACFIPASASNNPTLTISPSPFPMAPGQTQILTAATSDGSQILRAAHGWSQDRSMRFRVSARTPPCLPQER